ncbi:hypothetical protein QUF76_16485 [Desulfobacterales bacterium HSG16]|nr:hypothetical protein [Desulfobacterales bacterium HSG16]
MIERKNPGFIWEKFAPVIAVILFMYIAYFIPDSYYEIRILIFMFGLIGNAVLHLMILLHIQSESVLVVEYGIILIYALVAVSILLTTWEYKLEKKKKAVQQAVTLAESDSIPEYEKQVRLIDRKLKLFLRSGQIIYPAISIITGLSIMQAYWY